MIKKVELDHIIVYARDSQESASFISQVLGLPGPETVGPFTEVKMTNMLSLDFMDSEEEIITQHYAFCLDETSWKNSMEAIIDLKINYWADPNKTRLKEINQEGGESRVCFDDPSGHLMEIFKRN